jgi:hypothetical protein
MTDFRRTVQGEQGANACNSKTDGRLPRLNVCKLPNRVFTQNLLFYRCLGKRPLYCQLHTTAAHVWLQVLREVWTQRLDLILYEALTVTVSWRACDSELIDLLQIRVSCWA